MAPPNRRGLYFDGTEHLLAGDLVGALLLSWPSAQRCAFFGCHRSWHAVVSISIN